eukprot:TRINITY_DN15586_c0_g1_i1.p1 TRINITY_DN15586_c0_g1~~TRINITY_DN15586_c0_g1_i1.p1  ORF type:complete len:699 (-),score=92.17 TRINITY_DN15586_c0_g1_i1:899-2995(-)
MGAAQTVSSQVKVLDGTIDAVGISPDGKILASASSDYRLRLWDLKKDKLKLRSAFGTHSNYVHCVAFSPDSLRLASASADNTIRIWNVADRDCVTILNGHGDWVFACSFSPDGSILASSSADQTIKLWSMTSFQCIATLVGHTYWVRSVRFSRKGDVILSASADGSVKLWSASPHECIGTIKTRAAHALCAEFSPDATRIASGGSDACVHIYNVATLQLEKTLTGHLNEVTSVSFSNNGSLLASASKDYTIRVWAMKSLACAAVLQGHTHWVRGLSFSPTNVVLVSCSSDGTMRLWHMPTASEVSKKAAAFKEPRQAGHPALPVPPGAISVQTSISCSNALARQQAFDACLCAVTTGSLQDRISEFTDLLPFEIRSADVVHHLSAILVAWADSLADNVSQRSRSHSGCSNSSEVGPFPPSPRGGGASHGHRKQHVRQHSGDFLMDPQLNVPWRHVPTSPTTGRRMEDSLRSLPVPLTALRAPEPAKLDAERTGSDGVDIPPHSRKHSAHSKPPAHRRTVSLNSGGGLTSHNELAGSPTPAMVIPGSAIAVLQGGLAGLSLAGSVTSTASIHSNDSTPTGSVEEPAVAPVLRKSSSALSLAHSEYEAEARRLWAAVLRLLTKFNSGHERTFKRRDSISSTPSTLSPISTFTPLSTGEMDEDRPQDKDADTGAAPDSDNVRDDEVEEQTAELEGVHAARG